MAEYAKRKSDGKEIYIGSCGSFLNVRYEDRFKIEKLENNKDPQAATNCFWRLPFTDEDKISPGDYKEFNRGIRVTLDDLAMASLSLHPGIIQLVHECGLLININCYHGFKLPEVSGATTFWNGKNHFMYLKCIKNSVEGDRRELLPVITCKFCRASWSLTWDEFSRVQLALYSSSEIQKRLDEYKNLH